MYIDEAIPVFCQSEAFRMKYPETAKKSSRSGKAEGEKASGAEMAKAFLLAFFSSLEREEQEKKGKRETGRSWRRKRKEAESASKDAVYVLRRGYIRFIFKYPKAEDPNRNVKYTIKLMCREKELYAHVSAANGAADYVNRWVETDVKKRRAAWAMIMLAVCLQCGMKEFGRIRISCGSEMEVYETLLALEKWTLWHSRLIFKGKTELVFASHVRSRIKPEVLMSRSKPQKLKEEWSFEFTSNALRADFFSDQKEVDFHELGRQIIQEACRYPLVENLIITSPQEKQRIGSICSLLQSITRIRVSAGAGGLQYKVEIRPIVEATLNRFETAFSEETLHSKAYTRADVMGLLIRAAILLSARAEQAYAMAYDAFLAAFGEEERWILAELITAEEHRNCFLKQEDNQVMFAYKQMRLVFKGIGDAQAHLAANRVSVQALFQGIDNGHLKQHSIHAMWNFDNLAVYGTAYIYALPAQARQALLDDLCRIAQDAFVARREQQEKALYLLAYYLVEQKNELTHERRIAYFAATYGRNMYPLMENMWNMLRRVRAYRIEVKRTFDAIFAGDGAGFVEPLYAFLWWDIDAYTDARQLMVLEAFQLQHRTWHGHELYAGLLENVWTQLDGALKMLEQEKENRLPYVYALNALLYSLANLRLMGMDDWNCGFLADDAERMMHGCKEALLKKALVYCDYYTRKTSKTYQALLRGERKDAYLLSGAARVMAAYQPGWTEKYHLDKEMCNDYQAWYAAEKNIRWKCHLYRLLCITDAAFSPPDKQLYAPEQFLPYDCFPDGYEAFLESVK